MVAAQEEEEAPGTLDYPSCFHFRQLLRQKWKKADAAQTIKLDAEPLIVAGKESSVTTATEGREGGARGSVMGLVQDGSQGVGSSWHPQKVGVSAAFPPEGRGKV